MGGSYAGRVRDGRNAGFLRALWELLNPPPAANNLNGMIKTSIIDRPDLLGRGKNPMINEPVPLLSFNMTKASVPKRLGAAPLRKKAVNWLDSTVQQAEPPIT